MPLTIRFVCLSTISRHISNSTAHTCAYIETHILIYTWRCNWTHLAMYIRHERIMSSHVKATRDVKTSTKENKLHRIFCVDKVLFDTFWYEFGCCCCYFSLDSSWPLKWTSVIAITINVNQRCFSFTCSFSLFLSYSLHCI